MENIIEWLVWGMRMEMVNIEQRKKKKKHIINKFIYYENILSFVRFFFFGRSIFMAMDENTHVSHT